MEFNTAINSHCTSPQRLWNWKNPKQIYLYIYHHKRLIIAKLHMANFKNGKFGKIFVTTNIVNIEHRGTGADMRKD